MIPVVSNSNVYQPSVLPLPCNRLGAMPSTVIENVRPALLNQNRYNRHYSAGGGGGGFGDSRTSMGSPPARQLKGISNLARAGLLLTKIRNERFVKFSIAMSPVSHENALPCWRPAVIVLFRVLLCCTRRFQETCTISPFNPNAYRRIL